MSYLDLLRTLTTNRAERVNWNELQTIVTNHGIYDEDVVDIWRKDPLYIERKILNYAVEAFNLRVNFEFILGMGGYSSAFMFKMTDGTASGLFLDEVLDLSIMEVFLTVWAVVYKPEFKNLCKDKLKYLLKERLVERVKYSRKNPMVDIIQETDMSDLAVIQAFDMYWATWTFVIGHELYHLINREVLSVREEEFRADRFGFQLLLRFIKDQKEGILPKEIDCFYEEYYLAPCMLMYTFRAMDRYRTVPLHYGDSNSYPSPEERMQFIIDLFETDVPDDMDTTKGNAFLTTFLDNFDYISED